MSLSSLSDESLLRYHANTQSMLALDISLHGAAHSLECHRSNRGQYDYRTKQTAAMDRD
jgi:hypothetical protein